MSARRNPEILDVGSRLTVNLGALVENWCSLALYVNKDCVIAAVLKADAYGVGIESAARALAAAGCQIFFVALPDEGCRLRSVEKNATIYVLGGLLPGSAKMLVANDLRPVLGSLPEIYEWAAIKRAGALTQSALHVDTGMNRLGLTLAETRSLVKDCDTIRVVNPSLLISHLACADIPDHPMNRSQLARFSEVRALLPNVPASFANSAGIFLGTDYHFDLVRPGIALYGAAFSQTAGPLRPVATLEARIFQVRETGLGESVGYGAKSTVLKPGRLAVLGAGYADGYHRMASSSDNRVGAHVFIRGQSAPIIGRVSMDLITVDVSNIPGVQRGDWAELFGAQVTVDEVARYAGTIGYELLTSMGSRSKRVYICEEINC
jgi:alanine racemase